MFSLKEQPSQILERQDDESLCRLAASGSREAEEILVCRYTRLVRTCARPFFLIGGDSEDLTQEGMVGLIKAVREYDAEKAASFRTFAEVCIRNRLYSVLRAAARDKHLPLNQSVPLDPPFFDSNSYTSGTNDLAQGNPETFLIDREHTAARDKHLPLNQSVPLDPPFFDSNSYTSGTNDLAQGNPETFLIDREHTAALLAGVRKQLSEFEAKILGYYLDGLSCREIAGLVGKPPKSVDNAVQRIRRKVARQLISGELSES